jgi:hypothetical protein
MEGNAWRTVELSTVFLDIACHALQLLVEFDKILAAYVVLNVVHLMGFAVQQMIRF